MSNACVLSGDMQYRSQAAIQGSKFRREKDGHYARVQEAIAKQANQRLAEIMRDAKTVYALQGFPDVDCWFSGHGNMATHSAKLAPWGIKKVEGEG